MCKSTCPWSATCSCLARLPAKQSSILCLVIVLPLVPVAMQHPYAWSSARLTCPPAERFGLAETAAGEQCLPLDLSPTAKLGHGLGGGEWEATQDTGGLSRLGAGRRPLFCGVLGVVETALGFSIPSLAVSGPDSATEDDDHNDSFQRTGELFAVWQPGVPRTPCSGYRCSPHPAQQQGSRHLYQCATQLRRWSLISRSRRGGVTATCGSRRTST